MYIINNTLSAVKKKFRSFTHIKAQTPDGTFNLSAKSPALNIIQTDQSSLII